MVATAARPAERNSLPRVLRRRRSSSLEEQISELDEESSPFLDFETVEPPPPPFPYEDVRVLRSWVEAAPFWRRVRAPAYGLPLSAPSPLPMYPAGTYFP